MVSGEEFAMDSMSYFVCTHICIQLNCKDNDYD